MPYEFRLDLSSPTGVKFAEVTNFEQLACSTGVNSVGALSVLFPADHAGAAQLEERSQMDLYFRHRQAGLPWTPFFGGLYLSQERTYAKQHRFLATAVGYKWMLGTRIVAWAAGRTNRSRFLGTPAESIMKTLVQYNITSSASTANGRIRTGANWPATVMTIQVDNETGNLINWYCAQDNLLETISDLAKIAGGDFDLVKVGSTFDFRWYLGQLGTDRTATLTFGLEQGNMGEATYKRNRISESTVAIVGGQGEEALRDFAVRTGAGYSSSFDMETFVEATQVDKGDIDGLEDAGDKALYEKRAPTSFEFEIIQTPGCRFGVHYKMGDLVTAVNPYNGATLPQKVVTADLSLTKGRAPKLVVKAETP